MEHAPPIGPRPRILLEGGTRRFKLSPFEIIMLVAIVAVGAFAVGTFGLGFTLGGLVFGRRARKA